MSRSLPERTKLTVFFVSTYAWSWLFWFPAVRHLSQDVLAAPPWALAMLLIGAYGPSLMALAVTGLTEGVSGVKSLLGRCLIWRVGLRWYAVVMLLPSLVTLGAIAILVTRGGDIGSFSMQRAHVIFTWVHVHTGVAVLLTLLALGLGHLYSGELRKAYLLVGQALPADRQTPSDRQAKLPYKKSRPQRPGAPVRRIRQATERIFNKPAVRLFRAQSLPVVFGPLRGLALITLSARFLSIRRR